MERKRVELLAANLRAALQELDAALGERPPRDTANLESVMAAAPRTFEDLPAYFAACNPAQLRQSWVALVIELAFDEEGRFVTSRRALNAVLSAVRDGARANIIVNGDRPPLDDRSATGPDSADGPPPDPTRRPPRQINFQTGRAKMIADKLRAAAPNPGDEACVMEVLPDAGERAYAHSYVINGLPGYEKFLRQDPGQRYVRAWIRRLPVSPPAA